MGIGAGAGAAVGAIAGGGQGAAIGALVGGGAGAALRGEAAAIPAETVHGVRAPLAGHDPGEEVGSTQSISVSQGGVRGSLTGKQ